MLKKKILVSANLSAVSGTLVADTAFVTSSENDGAGTYRVAVAAANSDAAIDSFGTLEGGWDLPEVIGVEYDEDEAWLPTGLTGCPWKGSDRSR